VNTTELLAVFRDEVSDLAAPYLWSDALVYAYIDDAHKQFFRWTFGIEDSRSFKLSLIADKEWYAIDPQILRIKAAIDQSTGDPVAVMNFDQTIAKSIRFNGKTGAIEAFINGLDKGYLRAYPIPNASKTIELQTLRLPADIAAGDDFECDSQHVLNLLMWVKHRAYGKQDTETMDKAKSEEWKQAFSAYCTEAKREQRRLTRKVAVVSYGGI